MKEAETLALGGVVCIKIPKESSAPTLLLEWLANHNARIQTMNNLEREESFLISIETLSTKPSIHDLKRYINENLPK